MGALDGSTFVLDCDKACFTREFVEYYLELYVELWKQLVVNDLEYSDFIRTPEFAKLTELLDVKRPKSDGLC
eukprot:gnl/Chilomastix_caulleri/3539.p1 GENE.gnl/Chilomastix_caulleri/3539~~gnl/Chilomastix_caulleri/3539.p1  ORF type:complete len:72 (+),score=7.12 gnl/Chilomastix_caulleri/3539:377-592(+)